MVLLTVDINGLDAQNNRLVYVEYKQMKSTVTDWPYAALGGGRRALSMEIPGNQTLEYGVEILVVRPKNLPSL